MRISQRLKDAVAQAFAGDPSIMAVAGIAYDWLNDSDSNFGRCVDCNRLSPLQQQRHKSVKRPVSTITFFTPAALAKSSSVT
jgi:hypothetical protein